MGFETKIQEIHLYMDLTFELCPYGIWNSQTIFYNFQY